VTAAVAVVVVAAVVVAVVWDDLEFQNSVSIDVRLLLENSHLRKLLAMLVRRAQAKTRNYTIFSISTNKTVFFE
jgi:hypothetical protein